MSDLRTLASAAFSICAFFLTAQPTTAATYDVGPSRPYARPSDVPWESLAPGDVVRIFWRSTPYTDKWVLGRAGTSSAPITVRGMLGPSGQRPIINAANASTRLALDYWNENRGVLKIGGSSRPADAMPRYLVIENLDIRGARAGRTYRDHNGVTRSYATNAAAIYIEKGEHIILRNNVLTDSGNGLFIASSSAAQSRFITVEGNTIQGNGNVNSAYEHNVYASAVNLTFQFNNFGPLISGSQGTNLKDRSAGLVVRYNRIVGGNRQLDLVDTSISAIVADPAYRSTFVYGNVLVENANDGNRQIVHYGGDSGQVSSYRKGTLYFHHNTVLSNRTDRTTLFSLSTNDHRVEARNNVFHVKASGTTLSLMNSSGTLAMDVNWVKSGYVLSFGTFSGSYVETAGVVVGSDPGFVDLSTLDFRLKTGSLCDDMGATLPSYLTSRAPTYEYKHVASGTARPSDGRPDLGAYELRLQ